jgi:hypothetical protein
METCSRKTKERRVVPQTGKTTTTIRGDTASLKHRYDDVIKPKIRKKDR